MYKIILLLVTLIAITGCTKSVVYSQNGNVYYMADLYSNYHYKIYDINGHLLTSFGDYDSAEITAQSGDVFYLLPYKLEYSRGTGENKRYYCYDLDDEEFYESTQHTNVYVLGTGFGHGNVPNSVPSNIAQFGLPTIVLNVNDDDVPERLGYFESFDNYTHYVGPRLYILSVP